MQQHVSNTETFAVGNFSAGQSRSDLSRQWMPRPADQRYLSLTDLRDATRRRAEASHEVLVPSKKIEFLAPENPQTQADMHDLQIGLPDGTIVNPTHWSFGQLATLAGAPAGYLRKLPSQLVADCLNYGASYNREVEDLKAYWSGSDLLAATGGTYGRIFDYEVADAVAQIAGNGIGDTRWKIPGTLDWQTMVYDPNTPVTRDTTTLFASDRDCFIFLVDDRNPIEVGKLPNGDPDLMFRGFYVANSEVGNGRLRLAAFYLRAICCNRIMWGVEGFEEISMIHSRYAPSRFTEECRPALASFADGSTSKLLEGVQKAKAARIADDDDAALAFLKNRNFNMKRAKRVLELVEQEEQTHARTAWDFAQGITALARGEINNDERVALETEARKILDKAA